jgi:hypothetical protein
LFHFVPFWSDFFIPLIFEALNAPFWWRRRTSFLFSCKTKSLPKSRETFEEITKTLEEN